MRDLRAGVALEEVRLDADVQPAPVARPDIRPGIQGLDLQFDESAWPYGDRGQRDRVIEDSGDGAGETAVDVRAIPYFAWANRSVEAMRVWIPLRSGTSEPRQ